jgi:hypothetical protein
MGIPEFSEVVKKLCPHVTAVYPTYEAIHWNLRSSAAKDQQTPPGVTFESRPAALRTQWEGVR